MTAVRDSAVGVVRRLRAAGHEALFAGGSVRDQLLGRAPSDFDIATSAPPEAVQRLFRRTIPVGVQFGVVLVLDGTHRFEVATFRSDAAYVDGRRPTAVYFGSAEQDAARRDFTINALFLDPETDQVIDYVGGQADLRAGVIRAIGDPAARIREDRLRLLRAVRFAARFGFTLDPATRLAVMAAAPALTDMAAERIGEEIVKLLTEGHAKRGFELLDETGLLAVVLPEIAAMKGVQQSPDYHPEGDVFVHTLRLLDQLPSGATEALAWGCLLHDVAKPVCAGRKGERITFYGHEPRGAEMAVAICQRLRRSRAAWERVAWLVAEHLRIVQTPKMRLSTLKRFLGHEGIEELLELARIDALASNGNLEFVQFCERTRRELSEQVLRPQRLLTGADLLRLGYPAGPKIGAMLHTVEEAQLEGQVTTRAEALDLVRAQYPIGE
jgi:tRNA nucleotidyltransferase/poly(A) polymerase